MGLQLKRGDVAASSIRQKPRRSPNAGTNVKHPAGSLEAKMFGRPADCLSPLIVPLIEGKYLFGLDRIAGAYAEGGQRFVNAI